MSSSLRTSPARIAFFFAVACVSLLLLAGYVHAAVRAYAIGGVVYTILVVAAPPVVCAFTHHRMPLGRPFHDKAYLDQLTAAEIAAAAHGRLDLLDNAPPRPRFLDWTVAVVIGLVLHGIAWIMVVQSAEHQRFSALVAIFALLTFGCARSFHLGLTLGRERAEQVVRQVVRA